MVKLGGGYVDQVSVDFYMDSVGGIFRRMGGILGG